MNKISDTTGDKSKDLSYSLTKGTFNGLLGFGGTQAVVEGLNLLDQNKLLKYKLDKLKSNMKEFPSSKWNKDIRDTLFKDIFTNPKKNEELYSLPKLRKQLYKELKAVLEPKNTVANEALLKLIKSPASDQSISELKNNLLGNKLTSKIFSPRVRETILPKPIREAIGGYCPVGRKLLLGSILGGLGLTLGGLQKQSSTNDSKMSLDFTPNKGLLTGAAAGGSALTLQALLNKLSEKSLIDKLTSLTNKDLKKSPQELINAAWHANALKYNKGIIDIRPSYDARKHFEDLLLGNKLSDKFNKSIMSKLPIQNNYLQRIGNKVARPWVLATLLGTLLGSTSLNKSASAEENKENKLNILNTIKNSLIGAAGFGGTTLGANTLLSDYIPQVLKARLATSKLTLPNKTPESIEKHVNRKRIWKELDKNINVPSLSELYRIDPKNKKELANELQSIYNLRGKTRINEKTNKPILGLTPKDAKVITQSTQYPSLLNIISNKQNWKKENMDNTLDLLLGKYFNLDKNKFIEKEGITSSLIRKLDTPSMQKFVWSKLPKSLQSNRNKGVLLMSLLGAVLGGSLL